MEQLSIQIGSMEDVKRGIDAAQKKACTAFIEIGYILRKADDGQVYREQGYTSIFAFAEHEYGWDKSRTSRFMAVNREYSEGGYSCTLKKCYEGYGQAKLEEMLKLPEGIREEITPGTKRDEIRRIGKEYKEAETARQEEQFSEAVAPAQPEQDMESMFPQALKKLFEQEEYAERLTELWPHMLCSRDGGNINIHDILMALTPGGFGHARAGSVMLFFRKDEAAALRGRDKETLDWKDFLDLLMWLAPGGADTPEEWYLAVYGKELPKEARTEQGKSAGNSETSRSDTDPERPEKEHEKQEKTPRKKTEKSPSATGGIPEKPKSGQDAGGEAAETGKSDETSRSDEPPVLVRTWVLCRCKIRTNKWMKNKIKEAAV